MLRAANLIGAERRLGRLIPLRLRRFRSCVRTPTREIGLVRVRGRGRRRRQRRSARARENKVVDDGRFVLDRGRSMSRCSSRAGESECKSRHPRRRDGARGRARPRA